MSCLIKQLTVGRLVKVDGLYDNNEHQFIATLTVDNNDPLTNIYNERLEALMKRGDKITPKLIRLKPDNDDFEIQMRAEIFGKEKIVFFAITSQSFSQSFQVEEFMDDFMGTFMELHPQDEILEANANGSVNQKSQDMLKNLSQKYGESNLERVQNQISDVKSVMNENIQKQMKNTENIDAIEIKADAMSVNSQKFKRQTKSVKRKMIKQDWKSKAILGVVIFFFLLFLIIIICSAAGC